MWTYSLLTERKDASKGQMEYDGRRKRFQSFSGVTDDALLSSRWQGHSLRPIALSLVCPHVSFLLLALS
jgi:hypothetical protein